MYKNKKKKDYASKKMRGIKINKKNEIIINK